MFRLLMALMMINAFSSPALAADMQDILKAADHFRLPADSVQVNTRILLYKHGSLDKKREYAVFLKPGHRSLVLFQHPSERGQKMLMLDDRFWIVMPKSRRPIRVTAMQKLLGEASAGDIATMTWADDYQATLLEETTVNDTPALKLALTATRQGVTYPRIELLVAQKDSRPLQADLYVGSGKLAKHASFTTSQRDGHEQVVATTLIDAIQKNRKTVIEYLKIQPRDIADKYFNPMFLVRNTLEDLSP